MSQSSAIADTMDSELVNIWGNSEKKEYLPSSSQQTVATPYSEPEETLDVKTQKTGPR